MKRVSYLVAAVVTSLVVLGCAPAVAPKPAVSFKDKTITLLVPFSPGGSLHINAVMWQPFVQKHFPGNPTVLINNMPGAVGLTGMNWLATQAPKDGTVIGMIPTAVDRYILTPEQIKYDLKTLRWLVSYADTNILIGNTKLGMKSVDDLLKIKQFTLGELGLSSMRGQESYFFLKLLGADFKPVLGFASSGDTRAAIARGELHVMTDSLSGYMAAVKPLVAQGIVAPIAQSGTRIKGKVERNPAYGEVPTFAELLVKLKGEGVREKPEFKVVAAAQIFIDALPVAYPPGTPDEIYQMGAAAIKAMFEDPEFRQKYKETLGFEPIYHDAAETRGVINELLAIFEKDPVVLELMRKTAAQTG